MLEALVLSAHTTDYGVGLMVVIHESSQEPITASRANSSAKIVKTKKHTTAGLFREPALSTTVEENGPSRPPIPTTLLVAVCNQ